MTRDMRTIEKVTRIGDLFDLYGTLLTTRQREMIELHYFDDWSLAEIAEQFGVSRQAVHDNLRRAEEQLESYEVALSLLRTKQEERRLFRTVQQMWDENRTEISEPLRTRLDTFLTVLGEKYR
ncbi:MAG: hypothetical protein A2201_06900 [Alicyclobacillus sp. RIFOXYA1_FULL_53_8]|nr:MAG: hypothetical protein A2201_06900 [Alicyclobacillus sp. RIFOXYA1_FULL_53_8]